MSETAERTRDPRITGGWPWDTSLPQFELLMLSYETHRTVVNDWMFFVDSVMRKWVGQRQRQPDLRDKRMALMLLSPGYRVHFLVEPLPNIIPVLFCSNGRQEFRLDEDDIDNCKAAWRTVARFILDGEGEID